MEGKTDIRRTLLTLALITAVWVVWMKYFAPSQSPQPAQPAATNPAATGGAEKAAKAGAEKLADGPDGTPGTTGAAAQDTAAAPPKPPEQKVRLETDAFRAVFSTYGGNLEQFTLKNAQYQEKVGHKLEPMDLARVPGGSAFHSQLEVGGKLAISSDAAWTVAKQTPTEVEFSWASPSHPQLRATKKFTVGPGIHVLSLVTSVTNNGEKPVEAKWTFVVTGAQREPAEGGFGKPAPNLWTGICFTEEMHAADVQTLGKKGPVSIPGDIRWVGAADKYFMVALVPDGKGDQPRCEVSLTDPAKGVFRGSYSTVDRIGAGQTDGHTMALFAGPKLLSELDALHLGARDPKLGEALDYGWWSPISRVMLWILVGVHKAVRSWGLAIIALTLLVRLIMYPLTKKGLSSGREMAKLKPQLEALQKRYKDDKQRLNVEVMNLYKTHGVNPIGGCLPMLIQLPIWMALYRTLGNAVELYRSNFLWMPDLTQADPYYITPVLTGVLMFVQQKMTPMPTDNEQQKVMMYTMPLVFTVMSLWFPAGLTVYILTSTLLGMAQQWWMNKQSADPVLKPARVG